MELWEKETKRYKTRIDQVKGWLTRHQELLFLAKKMPPIPLKYKPSEEGRVALQISIFSLGCLSTTNQAVTTFLNLWKEGLFTIISLPGRLIFELWGASHFARLVLVSMHEHGNVNAAMDKCQHLLLGARSEIQLPFPQSGVADVKSIHVMDFVRSLSDIYPPAIETYNFLCESCHPSFLMSTYWLLAGPPLQNWENKQFREYAHILLERTLSAVEQAVEGLAVDTTETLKLSMPYIEKDENTRHST